jgi:hypothetical protein
MRRDLFKLRQTWPPYFPTKKLHAIDVRVNTMDPNWPVVSLSGPIHVNPKFISQVRIGHISSNLWTLVGIKLTYFMGYSSTVSQANSLSA